MRIRTPDVKRAQGLVSGARADMTFTRTLPVTEHAGSTIVRNVYECFRMLGEALLRVRGLEPEGHIEPIQELLKLTVTTRRPVRSVEHLRKLRHDINYNGYRASAYEVKDALDIADACFDAVADAVEKEVHPAKSMFGSLKGAGPWTKEDRVKFRHE